MPRHKLIYRCSGNYFTGWVVSVKREGRHYRRAYFSDKPDGRAAALARAIEHRDRLLDRVPVAHKIKRTWSRNTTGVVGVCRCLERTRSGRITEHYAATWLKEVDGKVRRVKVTFSVGLYGEDEARRLAIQARREGVANFLATCTRKWF